MTAQLAALHRDHPGVVAVDAEDRAHDLRAPGSHEPGEGDDLTGSHVEGDALELPGAAEIAHAEDDLADLGRHLREQVGDLAADHPADDLGRVDVGHRGRGDRRAVAHDGDGVAHLEDLVEAVADVDHATTLVAQPSGDLEQPGHLGIRQRRARLVHDDDARVDRQRLDDLDHLLVGDRQSAREPAGIEVDAEVGEEDRGVLDHLRPVHDPAAARLSPDVDVLGEREVGEERGLLVDDRDALLAGRARIALVEGAAVELDGPGIQGVQTREGLHQGGLPGPVLAEQPDHLPGVDHERGVVERLHTAEALVGALDAEELTGHANPDSRVD